MAIESGGQGRWSGTPVRLTQELYSLDKLVVLGQVDNDDRLNILSVRAIAKYAKSSEQDRHEKHHPGQDARKLLWLLHRLCYRNDTDCQLCEHVGYTTHSPMPSKAKTAVPTSNEELFVLSSAT